MRLAADRGRCEGHGMCEALAPALFRVGADGVVEPPAESVSPADAEVVALAVDSCPVQALRWIDD
ncbi:ferredoxin [Nocardia lijiangensis]|uniref:ferredoxin n=1 Tax=Nocardia lijiangensis TaxID=299618 RepID=UPI000831824D|nr:ferredoxin [Nocardia lijiangensis]